MMPRHEEKNKFLYKNLGPKSALLIQNLSKSGLKVFTKKDAQTLVRYDANSLNKILHNLTKKGWLRRIEKGKYMLVPMEVDSTEAYIESHFVIASKLVNPYYIGYWSALHFYGFTEQLLNTIFIVSTKRKYSFVHSGVLFKFIKVKPYILFGFAEVKINNVKVYFSDKEKTIVDCLSSPEHCGGIQEIAKALWKAKDEISFEKIIEYALRMRNSVIFKRLGYLLQILGLSNKVDAEALRDHVKKGYSLLDPLLPPKGSFNSHWNLIINISEEDLISFKYI